jgi:hypothetical protein
MKNIKCLTCKFYYIRPSSHNYNFSLCTKYNTFSVISRQDGLLCGPTYKHYEKVDIKKVEVKKDEVKKEKINYEYDNSYNYVMSQIHI